MTAVATAAYVEVLPPELTGPDHPEWFAARRDGVSASEIGAVLGLSPWESPYSLYWRKRGILPEQPDTDRLRWGRRLERHIADEFAERHPEYQVTPAGLYCAAGRPWQLASPDRLAWDISTPWAGDSVEGPATAVECKSTGSWDSWGDDGSDEVPLHIRAQALWQADVLGVEQVYVPVVNGSTYREYVVHADAEDATLMRTAALEFRRHIADKTQPDVDGSDATLQALRYLHPDVDDTQAQVPADLAERWLAACRAEKTAKDQKKTAEAQLRDLMGRARVAVHDGRKVATRVVFDRKPYQVGPSTIDSLRPPKETP